MRETDKFISKRGTEFAIERGPYGLFSIRMKAGGKAPPICQEKFTSYNSAALKLYKYLVKHDPLRLAVYPERFNGQS